MSDVTVVGAISGGQTDVTHVGNAFKCPSTPPGETTTSGAAAAVKSPGAAASVVIVGM